MVCRQTATHKATLQFGNYIHYRPENCAVWNLLRTRSAECKVLYTNHVMKREKIAVVAVSLVDFAGPFTITMQMHGYRLGTFFNSKQKLRKRPSQ